MKNLWSLLILVICFFTSCVGSRLVVNVKDNKLNPVTDFPLEVRFEEGLSYIEEKMMNSIHGDKTLRKVDEETVKVTTNANGEAVVYYRFDKSQPSLAMLLLGAEVLPDCDIVIKPLKSLPEGSEIKLSVPNP